MLSGDQWLERQRRASAEYEKAILARVGVTSLDRVPGLRRTSRQPSAIAEAAQREYRRFVECQREEQIKTLARQAAPGETRYRALMPHEVQARVREAGELALGLHARYRQVHGVSLQWMAPMDEWDTADEAARIRTTGEAPFKTFALRTDTGGCVFPGDPSTVWLKSTPDERQLQALVAHEIEHCRYFARTPRDAWDHAEGERLAERYQQEALDWFDHVGADQWRRIAAEYAQGASS